MEPLDVGEQDQPVRADDVREMAPNAQLNAITAGPQVAGSNTLWVTDPTNKSIAKLTLR